MPRAIQSVPAPALILRASRAVEACRPDRVGAMRETSQEMQNASTRLLDLTEETDRNASAVSASAVENLLRR